MLSIIYEKRVLLIRVFESVSRLRLVCAEK